MSLSSDNKLFRQDAVHAMNVYRKLHQVEPLNHNANLDKIAQTWADHLASLGTFGHNPGASYEGKPLGENCAMKWTSDGQDFTGTQCVDQWYSEIERYDFQKNRGPSTGHFTQVVWKSSRKVGLGRAKTDDGKWLVCANFFPAGNYVGHYDENVLPTRDGKFVLPPKEDLIKAKTSKRGLSRSKGEHNGANGKPTDSRVPSRGDSVKREVQTKTVGSGVNAVTTKTTTETKTGPEGQTEVTTTEETTKDGESSEQPISDFNKKFKSGGDQNGDDSLDTKFESLGNGKNDVAKSNGDASPSKNKQTDDEFIEDVIHWHNVYRAKHQAPDLVENEELTQLAQKWANHLAATGALRHSHNKFEDEPIGENVAGKSSSEQVVYTGQDAVEQWYKESVKYSYETPESVAGAGHFSQVIWKSSTEIGVGRAYSSDGRQAFAVCNYFPAGNYKGEYAENVLEPK